MMTAAYVRRKRFEGRIQAAMVWQMLNEGLKESKVQRVSTSDMLNIVNG